MQLDRGHVRWKKVRIPLFIGISLLVLAAAGVGVGFWIRAAAIKSAIVEAREAAARDTVSGLHEGVSMLEQLAKDYTGRGDVQAAYAYVLALDAFRHGPAEPGLTRAREALERSGPDDGGDIYHAASLMVLLVEGNREESVKLMESLPSRSKLAPELRLALALGQIESGQNLEAQVDLGLLAASKEPFLPAVTALARVRHRLGNVEGAQALLRSSLESHPGRLDATLELVLVLVDIGSDDALGEGEKLLAGLGSRLDDAPPVLITRGFYAKGLLLLANRKYAEAADPLCRARKGMLGSALAAARCARAKRMSGDVAGALEEISDLRLGESTPTDALLESVEANLSLWRPRSAALPLQLMEGRPDVGETFQAYMTATAAMQSGDFATAASRFQSASEKGDAPLLAALALLEAGSGKQARKLLKDRETGCAAALLEWSKGKLKSALKKLGDSEKCALALRGRFLFHLGRHGESVEAIEKSLAASDDPRLRVLLARATYRTSGPDAAKVMLDHLRDLGAESLTLLSDLAEAYVEMDLVDDARGVAADALGRNPGKPDAFALQARILRLTGDPTSAAEIVVKVFEDHPGHTGLAVERAYAHLDAKEYAEAAELGQKAMVHGSYFLDASLVAALALDAAGKDSDADSVLRKAGITLLREHDPILAPVLWAEAVKMRRARGGKPNIKKARGLLYGIMKKDIPGAALYFEGAIVLFADGKRDDCVTWLHRATAVDPAYKPSFEKLSKMGELTEEEAAAYTAVHGVAP